MEPYLTQPPIPSEPAFILSTVLRRIGHAIIACESTGEIVFMNHVAESLAGWIESEAVGQPFRDVFRMSMKTQQTVESCLVRRSMESGLTTLVVGVDDA